MAARTKNLTLHLPEDLIRDTKIYAAHHDTTINGVVKELLEEKLAGRDQYGAAMDRLIEAMEQGPYTSVDPGSIRREEIYER
jgi:plasmid stability protein